MDQSKEIAKEHTPQEEKGKGHSTSDISIPLPDSTTDKPSDTDNTKEDSRTRSESVVSNFDISLPEDMKNEENCSVNITLSDVLLSKRTINISGSDGSITSEEVPLLFALSYETRPIVNEFLSELQHVSECTFPHGKCSFTWCGSVKKLLSHTSICTDMECKECITLRPLLLLHSIQCAKSKCLLPFCDQYRNAWNIFILNMNNCPAPDFKALFSLATTRLLRADSFPYISEQVVSPLPIRPPQQTLSPIEIVSPSPYPALSTPLSYPPVQNYPLPQIVTKFEPVSPIVPSPNTSAYTPHRKEAVISTHYFECCKCHKKRAVPITLEKNMLPTFECSMNIWDTQYNNCQYPENLQSNYTISLSNRTTQYIREQAEFMARLKQFMKARNLGVFKQPMLGKREVDLYRLFREVTACGGCENVVKKEGTWSRIYKGMENYSPTETSASFRLKKIYNKFLIEFEREMFSFNSPLATVPDYSRSDRHSPAFTPRSPTPTYPYQFYPSYQWGTQPSQIKRYQTGQHSPMPMTYSPPPPMAPPPMAPSMVPQPAPFAPVVLQKLPMVYNQSMEYYENGAAKRYCGETDLNQSIPVMSEHGPTEEMNYMAMRHASHTPHTPMPPMPMPQVPMQIPSTQPTLQVPQVPQVSPVQVSPVPQTLEVSPVPQTLEVSPVSQTQGQQGHNDFTGKWESLMMAATNTAKQSTNASEIHL